MCSNLDAGLQHRKAVSAVDNPPHAMVFEEMHGVLNILVVEVKVGIHMCLILPKHCGSWTCLVSTPTQVE
jgi:hypothetical protein